MTQNLSRRAALRLAASAATVPLLATGALAAAHAAPKTHTVTITAMAFSPATLTIAAGDTVVFRNDDRMAHDATASNGAFATPRLDPGQAARLTFPAAARFDYICSLHPSMKGSISVG